MTLSSSQNHGEQTKSARASSAVFYTVQTLFIAAVIVLSLLLRWALHQESVVSTQAISSNREVTRLAIDKGITLCNGGEIPSGLLWLSRALQLAPADDADLQRLIRQNINSWMPHACRAVDILQHGASVQAMECADNGNALITAGVDGLVHKWTFTHDAAKPGSAISYFRVGDPPTAYAFDSSGSMLITGSDDGTIRFFNTATGKFSREAITQAGTVSAIAISRDRSFLMTGSAAGIVRRWDLHTGKLQSEAAGHGDWVLSVGISNDGRHAVSGANDGTLRLWNTDKLDAGSSPINLVAAVSSVGFSPDGSLFVAAAGFNATLYHTADQSIAGEPIRHDSGVRSVIFNSTGDTLATGCKDGGIRVWNTKTRRPAAPLTRCVTAVHLVKFSPDDKYLITADDAPAARTWKLPTGELPTDTINAAAPVTALAYTPDGSRVLVGTSSTGDPGLPGGAGHARLFRVDDMVADSAEFDSGAGVNSAMFGDDGKTLITGSTDNTARLFSYPDLKPINSPMTYGDSLRAVAIISGKTQAVAAGGDAGQGDIKFWDYSRSTQDQMPRVIDQDQPVLGLSLSPDRSQIADACADNGARLWVVDTVQSVGISFAHQNASTAVAYRPDGLAVLSGDQNGTARLWDAKTGLSIAPAITNAGPVSSIAFSPDGHLAVIGTLTPTMKYLAGWGKGTSTVQLWDAKSGIAVGPLIRLPSWATWRVAVSPDGRKWAAGSADGFVRFFPMPASGSQSVKQIVDHVELLLNRKMDQNQTEVPIFAADWLDRRKQDR